MKDQFNIAYTIDDNEQQLDLMLSSMDTLLKFNKVDNIYIMYWNIDEKVLVDKINEKKYLDIYDTDFYLYKFDISSVDQYFCDIKLPNVCNPNLRYSSLARWFITYVIPHPYYWYIDTDILFKEDIRDEFIKYQNSVELMFAFNRKNYDWDCITKYFPTEDINAGILFINAEVYNKLITLPDILNFYYENDENIHYVNQSCYKYLFDKFSDKCHIEQSDIYNIRPLFKYGKDINNEMNEEHYNKVKIFHLNGSQKFLYKETYNKIMNL